MEIVQFLLVFAGVAIAIQIADIPVRWRRRIRERVWERAKTAASRPVDIEQLRKHVDTAWRDPLNFGNSRARFYLFAQIYAADQDAVTEMVKDILVKECETLESITSFSKWLETKVLDSYQIRGLV